MKKVNDLIRIYITANKKCGVNIPKDKIMLLKLAICNLIIMDKKAIKHDWTAVLSNAEGNELFMLYLLSRIVPIRKKWYSQWTIKAYWKHKNIIPIDFREVFDPKIFDGNLGMVTADKNLFNTLSDMTVKKVLGWNTCSYITWTKGSKEFSTYGPDYYIVLEAKVLKKDILFCRQGPFGIEVAVQWGNINSTKVFEVN